MSELRFRAGLPALLALAALALGSTVRAEEPPPPAARALLQAEVVSAVFASNPTVKAALSDCRSAALAVEGEAARYGMILQLDSSYTRTANPSLSVGTVTTGTSDVIDTGAELKKHLLWGTDLTLRLDASRQTAHQVFLGGLGGAGAGASAPTPLTFDLGPGYGAYLKLAANQPLLRGGGRSVATAELRAARVSQSAAEITRDRTASEVLRDALTAYWEAWYATAALDIERRARETARRLRDDAAARVATGSLAPADGLGFETQLAGREEDVVNAETERQRRASELERLLGRADEPGVAAVPLGAAPPEPAALTGDLRAEALAASPELRGLGAQVELARVQAQTAGDALRPRLDVDGYVQAQGLGYADVPAALKQLGSLGAVSAHVGLTFELPLDDARHRSERGRAILAIEAAGHHLEESRQRILASVDTAVQQEASARRRVDLAQQTRAVAGKQLAAEQARFTTGGSTAIQVLQAEDAVRTAELRIARARADLAEAHLLLSHLTNRLVGDVTATVEIPASARSCARAAGRGEPAFWRFGLF